MKVLDGIKSDHLLVAGSITALFVVSLLLAQKPSSLGHDPKNERQGSTHHSSPLGGKALYTLLERLGKNPVRLHRALNLLPGDAKALLLLGPSTAPTEDETTWLRDWVTRGGTLVVCPRIDEAKGPADPILRSFGLELCPTPDPQVSELNGSLQALDSRESRIYKLSVQHGFRLKPTGNSQFPVALAEDAEGWVAGLVPRGQGRLIALAVPDLYDNEGISKGDNVEFMLRLADLSSGGSPVVFDEYHHGFQDGQSAASLLWASPSMRPVLCLVLLAIYCGVFASGRRLGPPVDFHPERRRRPGEFIDAFAGLCGKAKAGPQALSMVLTEFRLYLQQVHGAVKPESLSRIGRQAGLAPGAISAALDRATRVARSPIVDENALVSCCRELESLRSALRNSPKMRNLP